MIAAATKALFDNLFAEALANNRSANGIKSQAARTLGVSPTTIGNWADGSTAPGPDHWENLQEYFGEKAGFFAKLAAEDILANAGVSSETSDALRRVIEHMEAERSRLEAQVAQLRASNRKFLAASRRKH